ncbi:MAG: class II aldolase/adducin family protein [Bdellovibrionaceae bacterium]|nr:class II aldolase/adducin family protein [Pseudobdellovibrionaceae bacterium]
MENIKTKIVEICRRLHDRNMLAAADGNVSFKENENKIWITPTGQTKAFMDDSQLACLTQDNEIVSGRPSSERKLHLAIYQNCPTAKAVVHAHPPHAIAWSLAFSELKELPYKSLPEVILATGKIPIVPYARPGSDEMGSSLLPFLPQHKILIMQKHGAVAWGESLDEAYRGLERVEHIAYILKLALELKNLKINLDELPSEEISVLFEMRSQMGNFNL